jgi:flagella basal body P-ring formation protein FlgA
MLPPAPAPARVRPARSAPRRRLVGAAWLAAWVACPLASAQGGASAATAVPAAPASPAVTGVELAVRQEIEALGASAGLAAAGGRARVEIETGRLDPRLQLAPCERVEARLPAGAQAWGRTRVQLRCAQGPVPWQVYLPVVVRVFAPAWVAAGALPAGTVLQAEHLREDAVDWAADRSPPLTDPARAIGRRLQRPLGPGQALRSKDLAAQQWFAAGERVQVLARGPGFTVSGEAQALAPGVEGQAVRVRTDAGQVLTGTATGTRRVEVAL